MTPTATDVPSYAQQRRVHGVCSSPDQWLRTAGKTLALAWVLPERADVAALDTAVAGFVRRHSALQCRFQYRDGAVSLRRVTPRAIRCAVTEGDTATRGAEAVEQVVRGEVDRPFDVLGWPLLRVGLIQSSRPVLYLAIDHLVADGWSLSVAHHELAALYRAAVAGRPADLPPPGDFVTFAAAERRRFASGPALDQQVAAVHRLLRGRPAEPPFPVDARPWDLTTGRYVRLDLLDTDGVAGFARRCRAERSTVFMGLLAAFGTATHEHTGHGEAGMLVAMHNRDSPPTQHSVGWYANMLPLYFPVADAARFAENLRAARAALLAMLDHHELPLSRVIDTVATGHYSGVGAQYPGCFVSFTDDRGAGPDGPDGPVAGWERIDLAPAYRVGYGIWFSLTDSGLQAVVASPDTPSGRSSLEAFEATLARVLRQLAAQ